MGDARSTSTTSSSTKRKRGLPTFYAVKAGHTPGLYYSWDDVKKETAGYKNPIFRKFNTFGEAEDFLKSDSHSPARPMKSKYYGVQAGHVPGVYTDWQSVQKQVTGFKGSKQKSFASWEEAQAFVNEGRKGTPLSTNAPISLKAHLDSAFPSIEESKKSSKRQKKNDGSAVVPNGHYEPGTGPLPPDAEDNFDRTIKLNPDGTIGYKVDAELDAHKLQPTGDFTAPLRIWTDGAAKGNGRAGAYAGIGIWFGPNDPRNVAEPLEVESKQTNQRAELTAIARALDIAPIDRQAIIYSDSNYSIKCLTVWFEKWVEKEWRNSAGRPVENRDLIEPTLARIAERKMAGASTEFIWVKGHSTNEGNIGADNLANQGARKGQLEAQQRATAPASGSEVVDALANGIEDITEEQLNAIFGDP